MYEDGSNGVRSLVRTSSQAREKHGWLYKIGRKNVVSSGWHRRYVCCRGQKLFYFKSVPHKGRVVPHKVFTLGTDCRVVDSGLERGHGKELYTFLVIAEGGKKWKLGAISPEECASWMGVIGRSVDVAVSMSLLEQQNKNSARELRIEAASVGGDSTNTSPGQQANSTPTFGRTQSHNSSAGLRLSQQYSPGPATVGARVGSNGGRALDGPGSHSVGARGGPPGGLGLVARQGTSEDDTAPSPLLPTSSLPEPGPGASARGPVSDSEANENYSARHQTYNSDSGPKGKGHSDPDGLRQRKAGSPGDGGGRHGGLFPMREATFGPGPPQEFSQLDGRASAARSARDRRSRSASRDGTLGGGAGGSKRLLRTSSTQSGRSPARREPPGQGVEGGGRWRLVGLENGLRFFEEEGDNKVGPPCMKACGRIRAPSDAIFKLVMDMDEGSRSEWDNVMERGRVVESVDGHTDVIHVEYRPLLLQMPCPLWSQRRDLVCTRYWRREADGTYVVLFRSTEHPKVPPVPGRVRADMLGGGYIISPIRGPGDEEGGLEGRPAKESVVMHLLEISPRGWLDSGWSPGPAMGLPQAFHRAMLLPLAGMRELLEHIPAEGHMGVWERTSTPGQAGMGLGRGAADAPVMMHMGVDDDDERCSPCDMVEIVSTIGSETEGDTPSRNGSTKRHGASGRRSGDLGRGGMGGSQGRLAGEGGEPAREAMSSGSEDEAEDSGYQTPRGGAEGDGTGGGASPSVEGSMEQSLSGVSLEELGSMRLPSSESSSGGVTPFPKEDLLAMGSYGGSLPYGLSGTNCWSPVEGNNFRVRSRLYLQDKLKQPAGHPLLQLVAVDWFKGDARIDNLCGRPGGTAQQRILKEHPGGYIFAVNLQVPAGWHYSMVFYYLIKGPPDPDSLLGRFIHGDDLFRNARFKLIPSITEGAWVVKRSVGTTPLIVGGALQVNYHKGPDYFECDVDIGSSAVAFGVVRFVLGYVRSLVVDMAFLIEAQSQDELPERLLGTLRVSYLDPDSAEAPPPE